MCLHQASPREGNGSILPYLLSSQRRRRRFRRPSTQLSAPLAGKKGRERSGFLGLHGVWLRCRAPQLLAMRGRGMSGNRSGKTRLASGKKTEKIEARPRRAVSGRRDGLGYGIGYCIPRVEISPGLYIYIYISCLFKTFLLAFLNIPAHNLRIWHQVECQFRI